MRPRPARSALPLAGSVAALALAAAVARPAHADKPAPSVAIVCAPNDPFGLRVRAELEALGFRTVLVEDADAPASRASLERAARRANAIAAIRGVPAEGGVDVWIADRVTGKTVLRHVESAPDSADRDAALALRTVELLRASMLETNLHSPPAGEVPATPEIRERLQVPTPESSEARAVPIRLGVGFPSLLWSPGGFGPSLAGGIDFAWIPTDHVGVVAFAALPLTSPEVQRPLGSANLTVTLVGGGARFLFTAPTSRWAPFVDAGFTAVILRSAGTGSARGLVTSVATSGAAAPFARLGLAFAATPQLRVRADLLVGILTQGVTIQFASTQEATWGLPFVLPSLGVDFGSFG